MAFAVSRLNPRLIRSLSWRSARHWLSRRLRTATAAKALTVFEGVSGAAELALALVVDVGLDDGDGIAGAAAHPKGYSTIMVLTQSLSGAIPVDKP
jgi:hypothetical protein